MFLKKKGRIMSWLYFFCFSAAMTGCTAYERGIAKSEFLFDTVIQIQIFDRHKEEVLEKSIELCREFEQKFSRTIETSEVARLNQSDGEFVEVSFETLELIKKGIEYGRLSGGAFDITIYPVSRLWDFKSEAPVLPKKEELEKAVSKVGYENIEIRGQSVALKNGCELDLGGIAKGYIADRIKEYLVSCKVSHALINLGGNVLTVGTRPDGSPWKIGIQKPFEERNELAGMIEVKDLSVVSSGSYERYFELDGRLYHHILDPQTGYPIENELAGVTIISENSVDGDGLSTACFVLGMEKGKALIEAIEGIEAVFITKEGKMEGTSGMGSRINYELEKSSS